MVNRREKLIAMVLAASLGLLVIDRYILTPYLDERDRVRSEREKVDADKQNADRLVHNLPRVRQVWSGLLSTGLKTEPSAAENQALHAMRDWAQATHVEMQSLKPDRVARVGDFQQIRIQATGVGSTAAIADLLYQIETAKIPMKVNDMRLTSRKEGADDLAFAMNVSTIVFTPAPEKASAKSTTPKGESR